MQSREYTKSWAAIRDELERVYKERDELYNRLSAIRDIVNSSLDAEKWELVDAIREYTDE